MIQINKKRINASTDNGYKQAIYKRMAIQDQFTYENT